MDSFADVDQACTRWLMKNDAEFRKAAEAGKKSRETTKARKQAEADAAREAEEESEDPTETP